MIATALTRTDAFLFALKKVIEQHRAYIDSSEVRSLQLTIALNREGQANVTVSPKAEHTVIDCYDGPKRHDRFIFSST